MVISVDILMAKVNWEGFFRRNGVSLCVYVCVFGDIFYSCEIAASQLSRGHCFMQNLPLSVHGRKRSNSSGDVESA